jgi:hypothetical protein
MKRETCGGENLSLDGQKPICIWIGKIANKNGYS